MTRSGDDYVCGLRDGRTVLLDGERVADVTTHPAFAGGIRMVARLYDLAHDPANREQMTYPSPRDGQPVNKAWLVPRTREDLAARRRAIKCWGGSQFRISRPLAGSCGVVFCRLRRRARPLCARRTAIRR